MRTQCQRSQRLHGHSVGVVAVNFVGFSQILKDQSGEKKVFGCVYKPNSNNLKICKCPYLKINLHVRVVVDYSNTRYSNFAIEYLRENKCCWFFTNLIEEKFIIIKLIKELYSVSVCMVYSGWHRWVKLCIMKLPYSMTHSLSPEAEVLVPNSRSLWVSPWARTL